MDPSSLKKFELFKDVDESKLNKIAPFTMLVEFAEGKTVIQEGGFSNDFYAIESGSARVERGGEAIAELGPGDVFEVTANSRATYQDEVTLAITRAACHHPGVHPTVSVTAPREVGGATTVHRGVSELKLLVGYPNDWFRRNVAAARNTPGLAALTAFLLRRARLRAGLTLAEAAKRLGAKSLNAYARYEQGRAVPTVVKLSKLLAAVAPARDFVISESRARA